MAGLQCRNNCAEGQKYMDYLFCAFRKGFNVFAEDLSNIDWLAFIRHVVGSMLSTAAVGDLVKSDSSLIWSREWTHTRVNSSLQYLLACDNFPCVIKVGLTSSITFLQGSRGNLLVYTECREGGEGGWR